MRDATVRHIRSALRRLPDGGRLVVLTGAAHDPANAEIKALYADLSERASFVFTATVDGRIYARHGTTHRHTAHRHRPDSERPMPLLSQPDTRQPRRTARADRGKLPPRPHPLPFRALPKLPLRSAAVTAASRAKSPFFPSGHARSCARAAEEVSYEAREAAARRRLQRPALRALRRASDRHCGREAASDEARAIGGHGVGAAAASVLPAPASEAPGRARRSVGRAAGDDHLCGRSAWRDARRPLPCRRKPRCSAPRQRRRRRTPCNSAKAFSLATARAAARAGRPQASFSTTGCAAAARRCGFPNPTS